MLELFHDLFQTCLNVYNQLIEDDDIFFNSLVKSDALEKVKNCSPTREILEEILAVFRRKYINSQSMATTMHNFEELVFNPSNHNLVDFPDELQTLSKDAFGIAANAIIGHFIYASMPPHLKKSTNQATWRTAVPNRFPCTLNKIWSWIIW